jgi:V8-like Glu-specific endopeptidase
MNKIFSLLAVIIVTSSLFGQVSQGGLPYSYDNNLKNNSGLILKDQSNIPCILMSKLNDELIEEIKIKNQSQEKTFEFAHTFFVDLEVKNLALIDSLESGLLYRLSIKSKNAFSINLIFKEYNIPIGAKLFLYNSNRLQTLGAFTSINNKLSKILPTMPIGGEEVIVEYFEPYFTDFKGKIIIGKVNHDFLGILNIEKDGSYGTSGDCNVDINCPLGSDWQADKGAVCRYLIEGNSLCTGTLVNNTDYDGRPYFLTANHCISTQVQAENSLFIFSYESPSCNGIDGSTALSLSGSNLRATRVESDFTLLELSEKPLTTFNPFYAGWDNQNTSKNNVVGIHHPSGDVKKISKEENSIQSCPAESDVEINSAAFWRVVNWDFGVTEGGSSGSALFDNSHRVIGQLYGGFSACIGNADNNLSDWYGKFSTSWGAGSNATTRLKEWLDPSNLVTTLNGAGICPQSFPATLNITQTINSGVVQLNQAKNTITASNLVESGATATYEAGKSVTLNTGFFAEQGSIFTAQINSFDCVPGCFPIVNSLLPNVFTPNGDGVNDQLCYPVTGATNFVFNAYDTWGNLVFSNSGAISNNLACVWDGTGSCNGCGYATTIVFSNECTEKSEAYIVYVFTGGGMLIQNQEIYNPISIDTKDKLLKNFYINKDYKNFDFEIFPNPSNGDFTLEVNSAPSFTIEIFTTQGKSLYKDFIFDKSKILINKTNFTKGIYFVTVNDGNKYLTKKLVIE